MKEISITGKKIGKNCPIFLIAEAGVNHNGSMIIAKKLIDIAGEAKVDAVKFQTFKTEDLILKSTPKASYQKKDVNDKEDFFEMIKRYELTKNQFEDIRDYCIKKDLIFLSTPFDESSVNLLEELKVPAYKVGSGDMNNFPLLKLICLKKKPILLSTGMANFEEVAASVNFLKSNGIEEIVLFQCTTNYPADYEEINLNVIDTFKKEFPEILLGFSDHAIGIETSIGAAAKGVRVIEKHFTLDKEMIGPDHKASLNPNELKNWVQSIRNLEKSLGSFKKKPTKKELEIAKIVRKSIVTLKNIKRGDVLNGENIGIKRPGIGTSPVDFEKFIGKKINRDVRIDSFIYWEDIE